jgi:hypothetical protein
VLSLRPLWTLNKLGSNIRVGVARTDANFVPILYPVGPRNSNAPNLARRPAVELSAVVPVTCV